MIHRGHWFGCVEVIAIFQRLNAGEYFGEYYSLILKAGVDFKPFYKVV